VEERKRAAGAHTRWLPSRDRIRTVGTVQVVEDLTPGGGRSELFLLYTGGSRGGGSSSSLANDQKEGYRNTNRHCGKMGGGGGVQWRHRGGASASTRAQEECEGKARSRRSGAHDPRHSLILRMLEVRDRGGWVGGRGGAKRHWNENSLTAVSGSQRKDDARTGLLRLVWDDDASDKW